MKTLISIFLLSFVIQGTIWLTDINKAKLEATTDNKFILLNFSGSDWCAPCMRTKKEIFDNDVFTTYATGHLVLVNADFPRLKKNKLDEALTKSNESLADIYNQEGEFPMTLLLDSKGKVLKKWIGFPQETPAQFVDKIKALSDGAK